MWALHLLLYRSGGNLRCQKKKFVISLVHRVKRKERRENCVNTDTLQEFGRTAQRSKTPKRKRKTHSLLSVGVK